MKEVDVFIPCCIDQFNPEIGFDLISLLKYMGYKVNYNTNQTCCGRVLYDNGNWKQAKELGEKFIEDFKGNNLIVGCSTACIGYVKNNFGKLFYNTSNHNSYKSLSERIMDITEFICSYNRDFELKAKFNHKVFLHNNCHSINEYNLEAETRIILNEVEGLEIVNKEGENFCCGFGGGLSIYNEAVSEELARQKVELAISDGAEYIVSTDAACLMHINNYIQKNNLPLKTIHIVSLLMDSRKNNNE